MKTIIFYPLAKQELADAVASPILYHEPHL
jgi:hypothetical protein